MRKNKAVNKNCNISVGYIFMFKPKDGLTFTRFKETFESCKKFRKCCIIKRIEVNSNYIKIYCTSNGSYAPERIGKSLLTFFILDIRDFSEFKKKEQLFDLNFVCFSVPEKIERFFDK